MLVSFPQFRAKDDIVVLETVPTRVLDVDVRHI